eukprot:jgi/Botrbrau1/4240/Bobra.0044s0035.1
MDVWCKRAASYSACGASKCCPCGPPSWFSTAFWLVTAYASAGSLLSIMQYSHPRVCLSSVMHPPTWPYVCSLCLLSIMRYSHPQVCMPLSCSTLTRPCAGSQSCSNPTCRYACSRYLLSVVQYFHPQVCLISSIQFSHLHIRLLSIKCSTPTCTYACSRSNAVPYLFLRLLSMPALYHTRPPLTHVAAL